MASDAVVPEETFKILFPVASITLLIDIVDWATPKVRLDVVTENVEPVGAEKLPVKVAGPFTVKFDNVPVEAVRLLIVPVDEVRVVKLNDGMVALEPT